MNFFINDFTIENGRFACGLPEKMEPSKEAFEALGFSFEDYDDGLVWSIFPEGWYLGTYFGQDTLFVSLRDTDNKERAFFELTTDDMMDETSTTLKMTKDQSPNKDSN